MTTRHPPAIAAWIVNRLSAAAGNPALAGDLLEEFENGRSSSWYWRQTAGALAASRGRLAIPVLLQTLGLVAAYAAELPAAHAWWRLHLTLGHGIGWWVISLILTGLLLSLGGGYAMWLEPHILSGELKQAVSKGGGTRRARLLFAAAKASSAFLIFLWLDFLSALFSPWSSLESMFFVHSGLLLALIAITPFEALLWSEDLTPTRRPGDSLPKHELSLPVRVRGGRTIVLKPESLREALFASDESMLRHILRKAPSLAVLRRAIWLGSARNYQSDLLGESPVLTLSGLTSLIYEAARAENLAETAAIPIPGEVSGVEHELVFVKV